MPFDGGFLYAVKRELAVAVGSRIDKLYQPSRDELVFLLRKKDFSGRLLLGVRSGAGRLQLTAEKPENPAVAPLFCMLARKHFSGAKLIGLEQAGLERVLTLCFETVNEMGDRVFPKIVCEWPGSHGNVILLDDSGRILDALHRSEADAERLILPGACYTPLPGQGKLDLTVTAVQQVVSAVQSAGISPLSKALLRVLDGCSPLICREVAYRAFGADVEIADADGPRLLSALHDLKRQMLSGGSPTLLTDENGLPVDFSYLPITQYGTARNLITYESFGALLDGFYAKREQQARIARQAGELMRAVHTAHTRAVKRLAARTQELTDCADREQLRIFGELLKANLFAVLPGSAGIEVPNYYDAEMKPIHIPLNPALSPAANAAKYFKDYKKSYTAEQTLRRLTAQDAAEIDYLETVEQALEQAETARDLVEIREELAEGGYLRRSGGMPKRKPAPDAFREFTAPDGTRISVGRNNRQNDYLTTRIADKNDLWLHVKNIPGSHVVIRRPAVQVSEETLLFAAGLAARYSKARYSAQVPVDYTPVKYVKKPGGAKPGMVIYTTNQTVFVTPAKEDSL